MPSEAPTADPTEIPSEIPTEIPTVSPTNTKRPSRNPTVRPSREPTEEPSAAPTVGFVDISFNSQVMLQNITVSVLDEVSQKAVSSAVSETLELDEEQVTFVGQELVGTESVGSDEDIVHYQVLVELNVQASTRDYADSADEDSEYLYNRLLDTLNEAVESQSLTEIIRSVSIELNATGLVSIGLVNITVGSYTVVNVEVDNAHQRHKLTTDEFAGIVVGVVLSFLMCTCVCYAFVLRYKHEAVKFESKV